MALLEDYNSVMSFLSSVLLSSFICTLCHLSKCYLPIYSVRNFIPLQSVAENTLSYLVSCILELEVFQNYKPD